jgi:hypothetical protein
VVEQQRDKRTAVAKKYGVSFYFLAMLQTRAKFRWQTDKAVPRVETENYRGAATCHMEMIVDGQ